MERDEKPLILIVDDRQTNIKMLFSFLKYSGFKVLVANDGESAMQKLEEILPDIILLDVMMPGMDGFETCRRLKSSPITKDIPVIFMTALSDTVDKIKGLSLGAVDYITKPFQHEEVLARVRLHLRLRNLTKTLEEQNLLLKQEIQARTTAESELLQITQQLEQRVAERTEKLRETLHDLQQTQVQLLQREEKLKHDAFHDTLTDLPNRAWLMNRLQYAIELASEERDYLYAVLFLDLDRFKVVNDSLGHLVGDKLLQGVVRRLQVPLRQTHKIARFGGDEFVILLEQIQDVDEATAVAESIQEQFRQPFKLNDYEVFTGASIGITFSTMGYQRPEEVLRDADVAMYHAKQAGRGRYEVFNPGMQTLAMARLELENDLRRAISHREFCLHYQPIVSLSTGQLTGFEALLRWNHPTRGLVPPNEFIPVAEETGSINALGWWIFYEACRQMHVWHDRFSSAIPLTINVNVCAVQLMQMDFVDRIQEILRETALPGAYVKLEITESCFLQTVASEVEMLQQLKRIGIKVCIDDFGTGYSSLSRLHKFPIDTLKIDRSFVSRIGPNPGDSEIVKTIVTLAHTLGMELVAEGIETSLQLKKLQDLGAEFGQGYLFSKPVVPLTATQYVENRHQFQTIVSSNIGSAKAIAVGEVGDCDRNCPNSS